jgi:hypothetical protein
MLKKKMKNVEISVFENWRIGNLNNSKTKTIKITEIAYKSIYSLKESK